MYTDGCTRVCKCFVWVMGEGFSKELSPDGEEDPRLFQTKAIASVKALRWERAWPFSGMP